LAITNGAGAAAAESASEAREIPTGGGPVSDTADKASPDNPERPDAAKSPVAPSKRLCRPKAIPDSVHPGMWRVRWPDGRVSDMANLTRINDAIACFMETVERRQRGSRKTSVAARPSPAHDTGEWIDWPPSGDTEATE
jgi:hypothetical protein